MIKFTQLCLVSCMIVSAASAQHDDILIPYKKGDHWGFADTTGVVKIKPVYDSVYFFEYGRAQVFIANKTGFIDKEGTPRIDTLHEQADRLSPSIYRIKNHGKYGLITSDGRLVVMNIFDKIRNVSGDFYLVTRNGYSGVLKVTTAEAETVVPIGYLKIDYDEYSKRFMCVEETGDLKVFGENGERITNLSVADTESYTTVEEISMPEDAPQRYTLFREKGKQGLIITERSKYLKNYGKIITDTLKVRYDSIFPTGRWNFILIQKKKKWGAINDEGKVMLEPSYQKIDVNMSRINPSKPEKQLFFVKKKGKWGMIRNGEVIIPIQYDSIREHGRDYLVILKKNLYGVMSKSNFKTLTPIKYQEIANQWIYTLNDFVVFKVRDGKLKNVYVGRNGVEFYSK